MMVGQQGFQLDDPDSRTRSGALDVVHARAESVGSFDRNLFAGFASMRALTYTSSIPMILGLLKDFDYQEFECIFGHNGVLSRSAADLLSFQSVMDEKLNTGFVGIKGLSEKRRKIIYNRVADGTAQFYVVKDAIAHAKIYLLERDGLRRVIVGSANLSETAFSGRQAETLVVFDNDDVAWKHYTGQYEAVRSIATNKLTLREKPIPAELLPIQETPALKEAESDKNGVTMYLPPPKEDEVEYSIPQILTKIEYIKPARQKALADIRPDRNGSIKFVPKIIRQMTRIATSTHADEASATYLSYDGRQFTLSGDDMRLDADPDEVGSDVAAWIEFFSNYENGFVGDVPRLQKDYFTFMCWFYFSPLMCDVRNTAIRTGDFSFDRPMFAVVYGQSNCGKSSLINTLMKSMFSYPRFIETQDFTRSKLRGLQQTYKRFPIVFDDVTRDRFNRHAPEIIKDESIPHSEYPCFALSMNAEARSFKPEIVKRCLMIYTRTTLPGTEVAERRNLQRSVARIQEELTTSLYREYLKRALVTMDSVIQSENDDVDMLELSSSILCDIFSDNLPVGMDLPEWCKVMTLEEYQRSAFDRPRQRLTQLIHKDKYSSERKLPEGCWTITGDNIFVSVPIMQSSRVLIDIPDWIVNDTASIAGQIVLQKGLTEDFLGEPVKRPFRWNLFGR